MFSIIILGFIGIGIVSVVGYAVLSLIHSMQNMLLVTRNADQLEVAADLLRSSMQPIESVLRPPFGTNVEFGGKTILSLPSWLGVATRTPWGVPYAYCPYAPDVLATRNDRDVRYGDGTVGYAVDVESVGGREYVVGSDAPPAALADLAPVMLILSPSPNGTMPPRCSDVIVSNGIPRIDPNSAISGSVVTVSQASLSTGIERENLLFVAPSALGVADGMRPVSAMSLAQAFDYWRQMRPKSLTINLAAGTYSVGASDISADSSMVGRDLTLVGNGVASINSSGGSIALSVPGDLTLDGLTLGDGVALNGQASSRVVLIDSSLDTLSGKSADVTVIGDVSVAGAGLATNSPAVRISGGRLDIAQGTTFSISYPSGVGSGGSMLRVDGGAVATFGNGSTLVLNAPISSQYGVLLDAGASANFYGTNIRLNGSFTEALSSRGQYLGLFGSNVLPGSGGMNVLAFIGLYSGSLDVRSFASGSAVSFGSLSAKAVNGVIAGGGASLNGDSNVDFYTTGDCFTGDLFGGVSNTAANDNVIDALAVLNQASWSCK
ncbi:hypothetical protein ACFOY8_13140 [Thalassospira xianhensis]|uniref:Uncharacterized protein n=1 Tax=Thalassospira xianhensis MCCC 1A02616 TaxID=1177929 RepID=A0A367UI01_9PROT|nr:hypothetical protein [Thalassospira xianhensis]RCK07848.1 hypothetical protein TH5_02150 [Thalassospira xianhensis MCCC 1A02616]